MTTMIRVPSPGAGVLNINGNVYNADADGNFNVADADAVQLQRDGTAARVAATTTARRPTTGLFPGQMLYDLTLDKPIWRNAANSAWVDTSGASA